MPDLRTVYAFGEARRWLTQINKYHEDHANLRPKEGAEPLIARMTPIIKSVKLVLSAACTECIEVSKYPWLQYLCPITPISTTIRR